MRRVQITLDPKTGKTSIEVNGIAGGGCKDLTRRLEERLGRVRSREDTAEAFATEIAERHIEQTED